MKRVEPSPVRGVTLCHPERDDDQGDEREPRYRESQEQEACPFSLMDSCHGHGRAGEDGEKVRTWEPGKMKGRRGTAERRRKRGGKENKRKRRKEKETKSLIPWMSGWG